MSELCIEEYLVDSEKEWFGRFRSARLHKQGKSISIVSETTLRDEGSEVGEGDEIPRAPVVKNHHDEFQLGDTYKYPRALRKWLQLRIGDWPIYSFLLAFGQIIAANSYQITLLTGTVGQTANKLYVVASIYLVTSVIWWFLFRRFKCVYVLSSPFLLYGSAVSTPLSS